MGSIKPLETGMVAAIVAVSVFGDFNGDGKTDVFSAVYREDHNLWWMTANGGPRGIIYGWSPLRRALTSTVEGLIIADFDGNGIADVATRDGRVSYDGRGDWRPIHTSSGVVAVGRFDAFLGDDILIWNSRTLDVFSSGVASQINHSRQDMR